jgi:pilus assembly protein Flp/PilA
MPAREAHMQRLLKGYAADETGAAAIEYGLVASLISVVLIGALTVIGLNLRAKAEEIAEAIFNAGR